MDVAQLITPDKNIEPVKAFQIYETECEEVAASPATVQLNDEEEGALDYDDSSVPATPEEYLSASAALERPVGFRSEVEKASFEECWDTLECVKKRKPYRTAHTERAATWKGALEELQTQQPSRCEGKSQKWVQKQVKDLIEFKGKGAFQEMVRTAIPGKGEKFK
jgi:hypothetical protein